MYLFLVALVLHCCASRLFSNCGEQGVLSSGCMRASHCSGFSCCRAWALERWLSSLAHGLSCFVAHGIFLDQGAIPVFHQQVDSYPLHHQGSPVLMLYVRKQIQRL